MESKIAWRNVVLERVNKALDLQETMIKLIGKSAQIRLYNNGEVHLSIADISHGDIHILARELTVRFDKTVTSCGFLKYVAVKNNVNIIINTKACFYGGEPIVESRPRTVAKCPIDKKATQK